MHQQQTSRIQPQPVRSNRHTSCIIPAHPSRGLVKACIDPTSRRLNWLSYNTTCLSPLKLDLGTLSDDTANCAVTGAVFEHMLQATSWPVSTANSVHNIQAPSNTIMSFCRSEMDLAPAKGLETLRGSKGRRALTGHSFKHMLQQADLEAVYTVPRRLTTQVCLICRSGMDPAEAVKALAEGQVRCAVTGSALEHMLQQGDLSVLEAVYTVPRRLTTHICLICRSGMDPAEAVKALAEGRVRCAVTGSALEHMLQQTDLSMLEAVMRNVVVFARMQPHQKGQVMDLLNIRGLYQLHLGQPRHIMVSLCCTTLLCHVGPQGPPGPDLLYSGCMHVRLTAFF